MYHAGRQLPSFGGLEATAPKREGAELGGIAGGTLGGS